MEENNKSKKFWIILILIIVVIGIAVQYFSIGLKPIVTTSENIENTKLTVTQTVSNLESRVPFVEKEINSTSVVLLSEVGRELSFFIVDKADSVVVNKVAFKNGKNGFEFKYYLDMSLVDTFGVMRGAARTLPFVLSNAARANQAAIITSESDKYEVKVVMTKIEDNRTEVIVTIQPN